MTGAAVNRSNMRSPGRTPPFILIGLLVLVGFLGYSYWSFYAENSLLKSEIETVLVQKKDVDNKRSDSEKNLELTREEVRRLQSSNDQLQKQLQDKDAEINTVKTDMSKKQSEFEELQKNLANCDGSLARSTKDLEDAKNQNIELGKALEEEKKKPSTCDINACITPIKGVIDVAAKVAGTDIIGKALADAKFDAPKLMEGIALYEPARQQQPVPNAGQPGADGTQNNKSQPNENIPDSETVGKNALVFRPENANKESTDNKSEPGIEKDLNTTPTTLQAEDKKGNTGSNDNLKDDVTEKKPEQDENKEKEKKSDV